MISQMLSPICYLQNSNPKQVRAYNESNQFNQAFSKSCQGIFEFKRFEVRVSRCGLRGTRCGFHRARCVLHVSGLRVVRCDMRGNAYGVFI